MSSDDIDGIFQYSPQVYMNFKNKSTEAVSIYQFLLDLTGGALSLIQVSKYHEL